MKSSFLFAIVTALLLAASGSARTAPKGITYGATVLFGYCAATDTSCQFSNRIRNDIAGSPYVNGDPGTSILFHVSDGTATRDLTIMVSNPSNRYIQYDFRNATDLTNAPAWWFTAPQQNTGLYFNVNGAYYAKENCNGAATCNINYVTNTVAIFGVKGYPNYKLLWNPGAIHQPVNSPTPTVQVNVNYIKDSSGEVFIITPIPNLAGQSIAGMETCTTTGNTTTCTGAGQYNMPFTMTMHLQ
jgi:hypothetical protein